MSRPYSQSQETLQMCKWNPDPKEPDYSRWCNHGHQEHEELYNPHKRYLPPKIWCNACWTVCAFQSGKEVKKGLAAKLSDAFNGTTRAPPYITSFNGSSSDSQRPQQQLIEPNSNSNSNVLPNRMNSPQQIPGLTPMAGPPTVNQIPTGHSTAPPPRVPHTASGTGIGTGTGTSMRVMSEIPTGLHSDSTAPLSGMSPLTGPPPPGLSSPNQFSGMSPPLMRPPPNNQMTTSVMMGPRDVQTPTSLPQLNDNNNHLPDSAYQRHYSGPMQNHNLARNSEFEGSTDLK